MQEEFRVVTDGVAYWPQRFRRAWWTLWLGKRWMYMFHTWDGLEYFGHQYLPGRRTEQMAWEMIKEVRESERLAKIAPIPVPKRP